MSEYEKYPDERAMATSAGVVIIVIAGLVVTASICSCISGIIVVFFS